MDVSDKTPKPKSALPAPAAPLHARPNPRRPAPPRPAPPLPARPAVGGADKRSNMSPRGAGGIGAQCMVQLLPPKILFRPLELVKVCYLRGLRLTMATVSNGQGMLSMT